MTTGQPANGGNAKVKVPPNDFLLDSASLAPVETFPQQHLDRIVFLAKEYAHLADTLNYRNNEMQSVVRDIKRLPEYQFRAKRRDPQPCERCPKLEYQNQRLQSRSARLIRVARKLAGIAPRNHPSYKAFVKELNELDNSSSSPEELVVTNGLTETVFGTDETVVVESPPKEELEIDETVAIKATKSTHRQEEILVNETPKLAPKVVEKDVSKTNYGERSTSVTCTGQANRAVSPIIERCRNNKRRAKSISTKKRNKVESVQNTIDHDSDLEFSDFEVFSHQSKSRAETPDFVEIKHLVTPLENIDELSTPTAAKDQSLNSIDDIIEPTQKVPSRRLANRGCRSLSFAKPNLNDATIEQLPEECPKSAAEKTSPLGIIITSSSSNGVNSTSKSPMKGVKKNKADEGDELVFKNPKGLADEVKKKNPETKWNLAPSRQPTNSKLKQTLLTTTTVQKKMDITKQEKFNGGLLRSTETKKTGVENLPPNKQSDENSLSPTFESAITSTVNDVVSKTPVKNDKVDRFAKYANNVVDNSFDVIPRTSPNFKYQRDAVRKKCERHQLPGQACDCCVDYYNALAEEEGETQAKIMMDKFSRHRDKNPQTSATPAGIWNIGFDSSDEMQVMSRP